jgi:FkbM family methyltransferase
MAEPLDKKKQTRTAYYLKSIKEILIGIQPVLPVFLRFLGIGKNRILRIQLRETRLQFDTRTAMDIWSVKETFLDRFYTIFGTSPENGWKVVDIGGGIGDYAIYASYANPDSSIFTFEPTRSSYSLLKSNLQINGIVNVRTFPEAVWSKPGTLIMDASSNEPVTYRSMEQTAANHTGDQNAVKSVTLEGIFERETIDKCDLLKIDCEGAEYPILFCTPEEVFERIERIILEYHEFTPDQSVEKIISLLSGIGYSVKIHPNYVHDHLGYLYAYR